jgi:RNA polymerase sigma-70 factor (ECF subfamily)
MSGLLLHEQLGEILPRLWAFALRLTSDQRQAKTLIERAYVGALEKAGQWQPHRSAVNFMLSNMCSVWMRECYPDMDSQNKKVGVIGEYPSFIAAGGKIDSPREASLERLRQGINTLPEMQRIVMILVGAEGYPCAQVAELLNLPVHYVAHQMLEAGSTMASFLKRDGAH